MKKILSLAVALLLVFAIAAPAMAITGYVDPATSSLPNAPWQGNLKLTAGNPSMISLLTMQDISANKAYIYNETLYYVVSLYTPTFTTCSYPAYDYQYAAGSEAYVRLSSDVAALQLNTVSVYLVPSGSSSIITCAAGGALIPVMAPDTFYSELDSYKNELKVYLPSVSATVPTLLGGSYPDWTNTPGHTAKTTYIVGTAVVSASVNGTLKAVIRSGQLNKWQSLNSTNRFPTQITPATAYEFYSGKTLKYKVFRELGLGLSTVDVPASRITVMIMDGANVNYGVMFERTAGNVVCKDGIYVVTPAGTLTLPIAAPTAAGDVYRVLMPQWVGSGVTELTFKDVNAAGLTVTASSQPALFKSLSGAYNEVMSFFGFNYSAEGKLYDVHFLQKLQSFGAEAEVPVTLYGTAITIPDAGTEIPQTGDAASTLGFVMIALAIVAAAAVAYKKVRA